MHKCRVPGCNTVKELEQMTFFRFPKDRARCLAWCSNLGMDYSTVYYHSQICAKHFDKSQFSANSKRLKKDALPAVIVINSAKTLIPDPLSASQFVKTFESTTTPLPVTTNRILKKILPNTTPATYLSFRLTTAVATENAITAAPSSESENRILKKRLHNLTEENLRIKKRLRNLTQENCRIKKRIVNQQPKTNDEVLDAMFGSEPSFLEMIRGQMKRFKSKKRHFYNDEEKAMALTIFDNCGRKGYGWLKQLGWKLPSLSSLKLVTAD